MNPKLKHSQTLELIQMMQNAHSVDAIIEYIVDQTEVIDISPCPFCGHIPLMDDNKSVFCSHRECHIHMKGIPYNSWQTRWLPNEE